MTEQMNEENEVYDENGVRINFNNSGNKRRAINKIRSLIPIVCLAVFLSIGFFVEDSWGKAWLVFLLIPVLEIFLSAITSNTKKKIMLFTMLIAIAIYVGLGIFLGAMGYSYVWLKLLVVFLIIPMVSIIIR